MKEEPPYYTVRWEITGFLEPTPTNPKGIKVTASGKCQIHGIRPASSHEIPFEVLDSLRTELMDMLHLCWLQGETVKEPGRKCYPFVRLFE